MRSTLPARRTGILEGMRTRTSYVPVAGKTYSLFGDGLSTEPYYERIRGVADEILHRFPGEEALLSLIRKAGGRGTQARRSSRCRARSRTPAGGR